MKETLEEAEDFAKTKYGPTIYGLERVNAFKDGAKWQQARSYSEEDIKKAFFSGCLSETQIKPRIKCWEEWFEQFKKK